MDPVLSYLGNADSLFRASAFLRALGGTFEYAAKCWATVLMSVTFVEYFRCTRCWDVVSYISENAGVWNCDETLFCYASSARGQRWFKCGLWQTDVSMACIQSPDVQCVLCFISIFRFRHKPPIEMIVDFAYIFWKNGIFYIVCGLRAWPMSNHGVNCAWCRWKCFQTNYDGKAFSVETLLFYSSRLVLSGSRVGCCWLISVLYFAQDLLASESTWRHTVAIAMLVWMCVSLAFWIDVCPLRQLIEYFNVTACNFQVEDCWCVRRENVFGEWRFLFISFVLVVEAYTL